ncbi:hypothetical protein A2U01_0082645, partial [Trifolium medium]|nr:hypothetical protein [Trifolium medium]
MARCAVMLIMFGISSANCAPRSSGWRVAPVSYKDVQEGSAICVSHRT